MPAARSTSTSHGSGPVPSGTGPVLFPERKVPLAGPTKPTPASLVAVQSFVGDLDGRPVSFVRGEPVSPEHPAVRKWPAMFTPQTYRHDAIERIEQATAAPGEKR